MGWLIHCKTTSVMYAVNANLAQLERQIIRDSRQFSRASYANQFRFRAVREEINARFAENSISQKPIANS